MTSDSPRWVYLLIKLVELLQKCNIIIQPRPLVLLWHELRSSIVHPICIPLEELGSASGPQPVLLLPLGPVPTKLFYLIGRMVVMRDVDRPVERVASLKVRNRSRKSQLPLLAVDSPREAGLLFERRADTEDCQKRCARYDYPLVILKCAMD